ncbi:MAG: ArsR/SmtB family transcription factor [Mangrovicoccus sp.]
MEQTQASPSPFTKTQALAALSALAQDTRLDTFRLLVKTGDAGLLAGEIGAALSVRQNTLSSNLAILVQAGLLTNQRQGRAIRYFANLDGMRQLLDFLMEDCCNGHPQACPSLFEALICDNQ